VNERSNVALTINSRKVNNESFTYVEHESDPADEMSDDEDDEIMAVNGNEDSADEDDDDVVAANGDEVSYDDDDMAANGEAMSDCEREIEAIRDEMLSDDDGDIPATGVVNHDKIQSADSEDHITKS